VAYDCLSAYLLLVAQNAQVLPDSRYHCPMRDPQDVDPFFEVAGLPDTVEIDNDDTKVGKNLYILDKRVLL
jgi:hypothetical protein